MGFILDDILADFGSEKKYASTMMFKNPPPEVCTQVLLSRKTPLSWNFSSAKRRPFTEPGNVSLCAGSRDEKQWEEKFNGNLVEAEGHQKMHVHLRGECVKMCVFIHVRFLFVTGAR